MIILLSKGNKLKRELYHLYLHRALNWSQVVGIIEKSYEVQAVCVDFRDSSIEHEDLINIETVRLAKIPLCLLVDSDIDINNTFELSNEQYGSDIPVQVEYDDVGLADFLSRLTGVDISNKVIRFFEASKESENDLGDFDSLPTLDDSRGLLDELEIDSEFDFDLEGVEHSEFDDIDDLLLLGDLDEDDLVGDLDEEDI